jgi:hypothetical protein
MDTKNGSWVIILLLMAYFRFKLDLQNPEQHWAAIKRGLGFP